MRALLIVCLVPALFSCAKSSGGGGSSGVRTESYSYSLTFNNCPTGKKTFSSKQAMCEALKDDSQNNFCARKMRETYFDQNTCPGDFNKKTSVSVEKYIPPTEQTAREVENESNDILPANEIRLNGQIQSKEHSTRVNGDILITKLEGKVKISNPSNKELHLNLARKVEVIAPSMGVCELVSKNIYNHLAETENISFYFMGADDLRNTSTVDNCLKRVLALKDAGFTVRLEEVPTDLSDSSQAVNVTIKVLP